MAMWQMLLYGAAVSLALRVLAGLMTAHKLRLLAEIAAEEARKEREEAAHLQAEKDARRAAKEKQKAPPSLAPDTRRAA